MPSLGADMESATLTQWFVKPGDSVQRGDVVACVETAKGIIDIEIFEPGRIDELLVQGGTRVPVGAPLALYTPAGGATTPPPRSAAARAAAPAGAPPAPAATPLPAAHPRVSPAAKRRARELGIDLASVAPTGPQGAVTLEDVERAAPPAAPDMRAVIGQAMSRSKREIPHYYLATTIDMSRAMTWLDEWNASHAVTERLLYGALLVKAVALALTAYREFNGFWLDGRFEEVREINIGVAIRLRRGGLVAPGVSSTDRLPVPDVMRELQGLVQRARAGRLRRTDITNATITLSSLGEGGVEALYPVIYPPQVAILGFGGPVVRPWVSGGAVSTASLITATLAADHRVSDGHRGSRFLAEIDRLLQSPEEL